MSQSSFNEIRVAAQSVLDRAKAEPDFLATLTANPVETLQSAGFALEDAREFSQELGTAEVEGYARCVMTCDRWTCIISLCNYVPITG